MRQLRSNEVYKPTTRESSVLSQCFCCFFLVHFFCSIVSLSGWCQTRLDQRTKREGKSRICSTKTKTNYTFAHTLQPTYIIRCFSLSLDHSVGALFSFVCSVDALARAYAMSLVGFFFSRCGRLEWSNEIRKYYITLYLLYIT